MRDGSSFMTRVVRRFATRRRRDTWSSFDYEHVLGTSLELRVLTERTADARSVEEAVLDEIDRLEAILSGYSTDSELARWQATANIDVAVSSELADVLEAAEHWRIRTNDAFNAVARVTFDSPDVSVAIPLYSVDRIRNTARRLTPLPLSFDGIAKGYIVSRAAACGSNIPGVQALMLNIGGDIQHVGDSPLVAGVANPFNAAENAPPLAAIRLCGDAVASSGGYRRGFKQDGQWHSHIVDPRTGAPASGIAGATVIAPDCTIADALSTALSVLPPVEGIALADSLPGVGCLLVEADGTVSASSFWTSRAVDIQQLS